MIGIIVPAHNEEAYIEACVQSLQVAALHPDLKREAVEIFVVLDSCRDRTGHLARSLGVKTMDVEAMNVGFARQAASKMALAAGARWLSYTDADSTVAPDWLASQLALGSDAVCGTVAVNDWQPYGQRMREHFEKTYADRDGHNHVHGANLGVSASAYQRAGGFPSLNSGEDHALVRALKKNGAGIAWSCKPRVATSVRSDFRAPGGFGAMLEKIDRLGLWSRTDITAAA
ncbi:MAG: glycosyltransferase family 2 protein [Burkholderiales bacterium]|nr:MAG: glycosyltransferase family 2 protein [Burkholderiales bacterium]